MAFNLKDKPASNVRPFNSSREDREPAVAFINVGVPLAEGGVAKIGRGIPLRKSNATEAYIISLLEKEGGLERVEGGLVITINSAQGRDASEFAL